MELFPINKSATLILRLPFWVLVGGVSLVKQGIFCYFLSPREPAENESIALIFLMLNLFATTLSHGDRKVLSTDHWWNSDGLNSSYVNNPLLSVA